MLALAVGADILGAGRGDASASPAGWTVFFAAVTVVLVAGRGGYRFRLEVSPLEYLGHVLVGTAIAATLVITARVLLDPQPDAANEIVRLWLFGAVYLMTGRLALAIALRRTDRRGLPTLVVGAGDVGRLIARRLGERPQIGLAPVGFLDKEPKDDPTGERDGLPVLGASWDLEDVVERHGVEHVIVTFSTAPHHVLLDIVRRCRALGIEVSLVPRLFEEVSRRVSVEHLGGVALLRVERADPRGWQFEVKYAIDRVAGALLVLALVPLLAIVAVLVRLTSPGPVFYRQARIGMDGREFDILKFRTMVGAPDAPEADAAWMARTLGREEDAHSVAAGDDRRTPLGRFLRRASLDELPQLLNVVRGDMSFVGPRPERTGYVRAFERHLPRYGDRHRVKSGITGWAQVQGLRGDTSLEDRIEWDNFYVENWSPWLDLKILLLTIPAILSGRGAE